MRRRTASRSASRSSKGDRQEGRRRAHSPSGWYSRRLSDPGRRHTSTAASTTDSLHELSRALGQMEDCTRLAPRPRPTAWRRPGSSSASTTPGRTLPAHRQRFPPAATGASRKPAALNKALNSLAGSGVKIKLVDTAHPERSESQKMPLYHDNLAIVELRPETRVAAEGMPVQFTVKRGQLTAPASARASASPSRWTARSGPKVR